MSELINNSEKRKELLKHMILQLHNGEAPDMVKARLTELLKKIPYDEVVEVEQELINEGLPVEEVLKLCDIHTMVLDGSIDTSGAKAVPAGHPVDTFLAENRELLKQIAIAENLFTETLQQDIQTLPDNVLKIKAVFNALMDVDKHYKRKEYLLFPFLEKYGITGPPTVMWGKHDETRGMMKAALDGLSGAATLSIPQFKAITEVVLRPALKAIEDMTMKEEEILFPMTMDKLTDSDWYEIYKQTMEFGFCLYDPQTEWHPAGIEESEMMSQKEGMVQLSTGNFSIPELEALFAILPVDMTFVDKDDKVRYFSNSPHRIFPRNRAILGRDVRMCHPPSSVNIVDQILEDFRTGKEDRAPFWINMGGKFIHIEYFAMHDKDGSYMGTLEVSQDFTTARSLDGEQRLLSYSK